MDAISLPKDDHRKVEALLTQLTDTTNRAQKGRAELLAKIATEIEVHTTIEEEIFYPAFQKAERRVTTTKCSSRPRKNTVPRATSCSPTC